MSTIGEQTPAQELKQDELTVAAATALVEDLADVVKVSALYPGNNVRVQRSGKAFLARCQGWTAVSHRSQIRVRVLRDRMAVDHLEVLSSRANLSWLARCMEDTALGGLAIDPSVADFDALLLFAGCLSRNANAATSAETFEDLWSTEIPGIEPLERLFVAESASWQALPPETRAALEEDSPRGTALRSLLEAGQGFTNRIVNDVGADQAVSDDVDAHANGIDLLRRIVDLIPPHVQADPQTCVRLVDCVLSEHDQVLGGIADMSVDLGRLEMRRVLLDVSSRFFSRADMPAVPEESAEVTPAKGLQGHSGDAAVLDDLESFLSEYRELGESVAGEPEAEPDPDDAWSEIFGVVLRLILEPRDAEVVSPKVEAWVRRCYERLGDSDAGLLRAYLEHACLPGKDSDGDSATTRVLNLAKVLERTGLMGALIDFDLLTPSALAATFPATFGAFLGAVGSSETSARHLVAACELIGRERFQASGEELLGEVGAISRNVRRLIAGAEGCRALLPLAKLSLETDDPEAIPDVSEFLLSLDQTSAEFEALRALGPKHVTKPYLRKLCDLELGCYEGGSALRRISEQLVRSYVEEASSDDRDTVRCVRAIGSLRQFWGPRTEQFVRELLVGKGFLRLRRRPRPICAALRTLLKTSGSSR